MALAIDKIEAVATDQASLAAALKIKPIVWSSSGRDATGDVPDFVNQWAGRRRGSAAAASANPAIKKAKLSLAAANKAIEEETPDPQAEARATHRLARLPGIRLHAGPVS